MVKFQASRAEMDAIIKITERAEKLARKAGVEPPLRMNMVMDIEAAHSNGCPLKLNELLAAEDFDFTHDVWGIMRHIDRDSGTLRDCFVPRYAANQ
jgi:hypothetical protein